MNTVLRMNMKARDSSRSPWNSTRRRDVTYHKTVVCVAVTSGVIQWKLCTCVFEDVCELDWLCPLLHGNFDLRQIPVSVTPSPTPTHRYLSNEWHSTKHKRIVWATLITPLASTSLRHGGQCAHLCVVCLHSFVYVTAKLADMSSGIGNVIFEV